jgi:hypothetical protein
MRAFISKAPFFFPHRSNTIAPILIYKTKTYHGEVTIFRGVSERTGGMYGYDGLRCAVRVLRRAVRSRDIRLAFNLNKSQVFRNIEILRNLEYVAIVEGTANRGYKYAVTYWDDADKMRSQVRTHLETQISKLESPGTTSSNEYDAGGSKTQ